MSWNGNTPTFAKQYNITEHLGSVRCSVLANGILVSARNYYPFGETLQEYIASNKNKRYRFTGKERDDETNQDYFGARYYDSELGRWNALDPLKEKFFGLSPYNYCLNNPLRLVDPDGLTPEERRKAIEYAIKLTKKGYQYKKDDNDVEGVDCSGIVDKILIQVMHHSFMGKEYKGWGNGVARIAGRAFQISEKDVQPGDLVTFRTTRTDQKGPDGIFDHIAIITAIIRNKTGEIIGLKFIHAHSTGVNESVWPDPKYDSRTPTGYYAWDSDRIIATTSEDEISVVQFSDGKTMVGTPRQIALFVNSWLSESAVVKP